MKSFLCFLAGSAVGSLVFFWKASPSSPEAGMALRVGVETSHNPQKSGAAPRNPASDPDPIAADRASQPAAAKDASLALKAVLSAKKRSDQLRALTGLIDKLPSGQLGQFFSSITESDLTAGQKRMVTNVLIQRWAETDPAAAAEFFKGLPPRDQLANVDILANSWASYDPSGALAWAQSLPPSQARLSALGQTLAKTIETDPESALREFGRLDKSTARSVSMQMYSAWVDTDPSSAVKSVLTAAEGGTVGDAAAQMVAGKWAKSDPAAALKWLMENGNGSSPMLGGFAAALVNAAGAVDPRATVEAINGLPSSLASVNSLRTSAIKLWLDADPAAAKAWFSQQPPATQTEYALAATRNSLTPANAEAMIPLVEGMSQSGAKTTALINILKQWASAQPEAALRYASQMQDRATVAQIMPSLLQGMASVYPDLALNTALALPQDPARDKALVNIATNWASKDPVKSSAQILALPESNERTSMLAGTGAVWAYTNPAAASTWAQSLPVSPARDTVLAAVADTLSTTHPEIATANAQGISDASMRAKALAKIASKKGGS
jgi:hypothetical protein